MSDKKQEDIKRESLIMFPDIEIYDDEPEPPDWVDYAYIGAFLLGIVTASGLLVLGILWSIGS